MRNAKHFCWILAGLLAACSKNDDTEDENNGNWVRMGEMSGKPRSEAVTFTIGDTVYVGTGLGNETEGEYKYDFWKYSLGRGWEKAVDFPPLAVGRISATAFVINGVAYVGTGFDGKRNLDDFWSYTPATGQWKECARLKGPDAAVSLARRDAVSFTLNGKGYVVSGYDGGALNDVWEYDPVANTWTGKRSFRGEKRRDAVSFVIGDKAYVLTGTNNNELKTDLYVYDAATDEWTAKRKIDNSNEDEDYDNDYAMIRSNAVAFVMNNKGYLATGTKGGLSQECWEYDPITDLWVKKRDFEGTSREGAVAFTLGGKGYVLSGRTAGLQLDNMFQFDPTATYNSND
ncbi:galactose oxidase [Chitinophaga sp. SYP-B3965]|uniref:Kelch repeat-containing protein n=1 Tax=Chitinophaga sp. SYP-B3965 TaxID=2663120 RepID=UPI001299EAE7|nr:kelch repeat-containing protein [Chitinophaga sp. SYP-B3965]MRG46067.1 galactose oxidase [Chitinophaga sp. SYP-B3965]